MYYIGPRYVTRGASNTLMSACIATDTVHPTLGYSDVPPDGPQTLVSIKDSLLSRVY